MYLFSILLLPGNRDPGEQFLFLGRNNEKKTQNAAWRQREEDDWREVCRERV